MRGAKLENAVLSSIGSPQKLLVSNTKSSSQSNSERSSQICRAVTFNAALMFAEALNSDIIETRTA